MNAFRRCFVTMLFGMAGGAAWASELKLPPLTADLRGKLTLLKGINAPVVHWKIKTRDAAPADTGRVTEVEIDGATGRVRAEFKLDANGDGGWRVTEGKVEIGPWFASFVHQLGADFAGITTGGTATVTGEGTIQKGELGGRASIAVRNGRVDDPAHKLLLEGVDFEILIEDIAARRTAPVRFTWTGGNYDVVVLGPGRAVVAMEGDDVRVEEASISAFGGELALEAFTFSVNQPSNEVTARVIGAEIAGFLPFLPKVVTDAKGRVDGTMKLRRDSSGIQISAGRLALREGATADLQLAPTPGLLSASLPPDVLKHYPGLVGVEQGKVPVRANQLEITFTPEGDAEGRSAMVHIAGGPVDPNLKAPIDLTVNVRGPLDEVVKLGSRLHFGGAP